MPVRKKVEPRKKTPPKFMITSENGSHEGFSNTEEIAILNGRKAFNGKRYHIPEAVGIYRLVKVLRPLQVPIEIEEVSHCGAMKGEK